MKKLLFLLTAAACNTYYDPCFAPASLVSDLRILAIAVEPPEVLYDPVTFATPPVSVRALVVDAREPYASKQIYVRACIPAPDGRCPSDQAWDAAAAGDETRPPVIHLRVAPDRIQAALAADALGGYGGVRVQLELQATTDIGTVTGSKILLFSPALPGYVPNHSFSVTGFAASDGNQYPDQSNLELPVGETIGLSPLLAPGPGASEAAETYTVTDLSGHTVQLRERISYSFFTFAHAQYGPLGRPVPGSDVADEPAPGDPQPQGGLVTLTALAPASNRIWVVARDGRGAEAWASLAVSMPDKRGCSPDNRCPTLDFGCL